MEGFRNKNGSWKWTKIGAIFTVMCFLAGVFTLMGDEPSSIDQRSNEGFQQTNVNSQVENNINYDQRDVTYNVYPQECPVAGNVKYNKLCTLSEYINSGKTAEAEVIINEALESGEYEDHALFWHGLSVYEHNEKRYNTSIAYGIKSVELDPSNAYAYEAMVDSYYRLGQYNESKYYSLIALEIEPNLASINRNLASIYFIEENYSAALDAVYIALQDEPTNLELLRNKALILRRLGKDDLAFATYLHLEELGDENPETYSNIANYYGGKCEDEKVAEYLEKFIVHSDYSEESKCVVSCFYFQNEKYRKYLVNEIFRDMNCNC